MFTEDGELIFSGRTIKGRADLAKHISAKMRRTLHLTGAPLLVQIAPGHMRVRSELLYITEAPQASPSAGQPAPHTIGFSMYNDDIVLTPQGWKFARREAEMTIPLGPEFLPTPDAARIGVR
jgi:ABC-type sugar transport system substrate-binding protein